MNQLREPDRIAVRSIFISDQHLGFQYSRAAACLEFLRQYEPETLYLVGDFLDGWRLRNRWHWPTAYNDLISHILEMIERGVSVYYTPGNHDDFLREPHPAINGVSISNEFVHETINGQKLLVTHGDLFDSVEKKFHRLSRFGSSVYDALTRFNWLTNKLLNKCGIGDFNYCFIAKRWSKKIVGAVGGFESVLSEYAVKQECDGVVCGHIHRPELRRSVDGFAYCNTGDWVEHRSAIVETYDGLLKLIDNGKLISEIAAESEPPVVAPS